MIAVAISILRVVDNGSWPEFVECELTDRCGKKWRFVEKLPVIERDGVAVSNSYPRPGVIACQFVMAGRDDQGRAFVEIDTQQPWGVESVEGVARFQVLAEQLTD
jgi:hypothetical protein